MIRPKVADDGGADEDRRRRTAGATPTVENAELGEHGADVGAGAEEGDVAEVEQAGEADDDVQAQGGGREDEDLGRDRHVGVGAVLGEREQERHDERGEHAAARRLFAASEPAGKPPNAGAEQTADHADERHEEGDEDAAVLDVQREGRR